MSTLAPSATARPTRRSFRWWFVALESVVAIGAISGVVQMWFGIATPPVSDLDALGLDSWRLPALWLLVSVGVPSLVALWGAVRAATWTPAAVLVMAALLVVEVLVQIPFVGPSVLQAVMGAVAVTLGALALIALRRADWHITSAS